MPLLYKDCLAKGLLKKIPPSHDKAKRSIMKAQRWLDEARGTFKAKAFDSSVLSSYLVMFHAARAILFLDGFRERSHICIARYLEEKYVKTKKLEKTWVDLLDHYREIRHSDQYDLSFISTDSEAREALNVASRFLGRIKNIFLKEGSL